MLAAFALTIYALVCLVICAGVALFVAYPARGRDLPGRLLSLPARSARAVRRLARPRASSAAPRGRRVRGDEVPQRG